MERAPQGTFYLRLYQVSLPLVVGVQRRHYTARDVALDHEPQSGGQQPGTPGIQFVARTKIGVQKMTFWTQDTPHLTDKRTQVTVTV